MVKPLLSKNTIIPICLYLWKEVIKDMKLMPKNKTGGIVMNTVMGVGMLVVGVIIIYTITSTILTAGLLSGGSLNDSSWGMSGNLTSGVNNVSKKIPTILTIVAVVFLLGALVLLIRTFQGVNLGGGASSL